MKGQSVSVPPVVSPLSLKKLAKTLSTVLSVEGIALQHHKAIEVVSRLLEDKSWNVFLNRAETRSSNVMRGVDDHFKVLDTNPYIYLSLQAQEEGRLKALIRQYVAKGGLETAMTLTEFEVECDSTDESPEKMAECAAPLLQHAGKGAFCYTCGEIVGVLVVDGYPVLVTREWALRQKGAQWANANRWAVEGWDSILATLSECGIDLEECDLPIMVLCYGLEAQGEVPMHEFVSGISHVSWNGNIQINTFAFEAER